MPYQRLPISHRNPGLILILIDQSESMQDPYYDGLSKAEFAARAVNKCIYEIIATNTAGETVKDRCLLAAIGYGQVTELLVAGRLSELREQSTGVQEVTERRRRPSGGVGESTRKIPVWVTPRSENGTPMEEAFDLAGQLIDDWIRENPDNFPPIIINITDGQPNEAPAARRSAQKLLALATSDGQALLLNGHISEGAGREILMPASEADLPDEFARFLYSISSPLPPPMVAAAQAAGIAAVAGSRGFMMNAKAEMFTKLLVFGTVIARR
jgi:hypothetical protein